MSGWSDYGFPDPTFAPAALPLKGLILAIRERYLAVQEAYKLNSWNRTRLASDLLENVIPPQFYQHVDAQITAIAEDFYHPDRLADYLAGNISWAAAKWKKEELLLAAAGGNPDAIIPLTFYDGTRFEGGFWHSEALLTPRWYLPWLVQRHNAVNLLRYSDFIIRAEWRDCYSLPGYYSTAAAARAAASSNAQTIMGTSGVPYPRLALYYDRDDGWRCDRFLDVGKIFLSPWEGLDGFPSAHYSITLTAYRRGEVPGTPGTGRMHLVSDSTGIFADWSGAVDTMPLPGAPAEGEDHFFTWGVTDSGVSPRFYADYYPCFHFKPQEN